MRSAGDLETRERRRQAVENRVGHTADRKSVCALPFPTTLSGRTTSVLARAAPAGVTASNPGNAHGGGIGATFSCAPAVVASRRLQR